MRQTEILDNIKGVLRTTLPSNGQAFLYGSQARGDAHEGSDWDVLIVVDKDSLDLEDYNNITYPLTKLGWDINVEINPIMYTKKEWDASTFTPFYYNVKHDGIAIV